MTFDQLNEYIQRSCRNFHGELDGPAVRNIVDRFGKHLTSEEQFRLMCQMVYDRRYDQRLKYRKDVIDGD